MNNENNSPMDSLNGLNNEPVNPVEQTPVPEETPAVEPAVTEAAPTPVEEPIPVPTEEPAVDIPAAPVEETAPVSEPVTDISTPAVEENPMGTPLDAAPADTPVEENPAPGNEVVELTPGPNEENKEGEPTNDVSNPEGAPTTDANQGLATATAIANNPDPINPEPVAPVSENDKTAVGFEEKKSNGSKLKMPLIVVTVLVVLGALGYFVVYPFVKNTFMATPKKVFETTITGLKTQINNTISNANLANTITDVSIKVDTNMDEMKEFKDYTYGLRFGIDNKAKALEGKAYMLDKDNKEYSIAGYVKGEDIIAKLSSDERLVKVGKTSDIDGFDDIFDAAKNFNPDDYAYVTNKIVDSVVSTFKEEDFEKEDSTIRVNGNDVKVKKNAYLLNKDRIKNLCTTVFNDLYNDSKAMEIIGNWGISKDEFKSEFIDGINYDDIKDEDAVTINIYVDSKNELVGFDVVDSKGVKPLYYYTNEGNFNFYMGNDKDNITADGVKNGDATDVTIKSNGKDTLATLKIYTWTEEEIKFDFTINSETTGSDQAVSGTIEYKNTRSSNLNNITLKTTLKSGSDSITVTLNLKQELNAKIANIDVSKAVDLSDDEKNQWGEDFVKSLEGTPFGYYSQMLEENQPQYYTDDSKCGPGVKCDDTFASRDVGF